MKLTKRETTIKYLVYCLLILVAGLIQNSGASFLEIGRAKCFFLIPVVVTLGIDEDEKTSALLGFGAGLLWDMISLQHMGFNFIFLTLICYITSSLVSYLIRSTYWVTVLASVVATGLYVITYWLIFVAFKTSDGILQSLEYFYVPCFIYTSVISLVIAGALAPLKRKLNKIED